MRSLFISLENDPHHKDDRTHVTHLSVHYLVVSFTCSTTTNVQDELSDGLDTAQTDITIPTASLKSRVDYERRAERCTSTAARLQQQLDRKPN